MMENKSQVPFTKNVQIGDQPKAKAALDQNRVKINLDAAVGNSNLVGGERERSYIYNL